MIASEGPDPDPLCLFSFEVSMYADFVVVFVSPVEIHLHEMVTQLCPDSFQTGVIFLHLFLWYEADSRSNTYPTKVSE